MRARVEVRRCLADPAPFVVYTAPKTGSTSLEDALEAVGIAAAKVHFLHDRHDRGVARHRARGTVSETHHRAERLLRPTLMAAGEGRGPKRLRVVAMVRDPVAQALSSAFQAPHVWRLDPADVEGVRASVVGRLEVTARRGTVLSWFRDEIGRTFRVDPADCGFDREAGLARLSLPGAEVMIAKTEALDRLTGPLSDLAGRPLTLGRSNVREATPDADRYRAARDMLRLPPTVLDGTYDAPLARAFYTEAERAAFRARWAG